MVLGGDAEDGGKRLAARLKIAGIQTTYVPDAALFPVITKIDKVLLGQVFEGLGFRVTGYSLGYFFRCTYTAPLQLPFRLVSTGFVFLIYLLNRNGKL